MSLRSWSQNLAESNGSQNGNEDSALSGINTLRPSTSNLVNTKKSCDSSKSCLSLDTHNSLTHRTRQNNCAPHSTHGRGRISAHPRPPQFKHHSPGLTRVSPNITHLHPKCKPLPDQGVGERPESNHAQKKTTTPNTQLNTDPQASAHSLRGSPPHRPLKQWPVDKSNYASQPS